MVQDLTMAAKSAAIRTQEVEKSVDRRIPSLDGLRAISILLVFVAHAGLETVVPGGLGVTIFFFLSGFLITTLLRQESDKHESISFKHFWLRRVLRILPPFYLAFVAAVVATLLLQPAGTLTWGGIAGQIFHFTNYWIIWHGYEGQPMGTGVYWSLAVEEHFYLLFPLLYAMMRRGQLTSRAQAMCLWALCAAVLAWRCVLVFKYHVPLNRTYMSTDTRVDSILFGCALAVWHNPVLDARSMTAERRLKFFVFPLALGLLLASLLVRGDWFRETFRYTVQGIALAGLFIAAIRLHQFLPFRFLNLPPMIRIGVLSYSIYLVHLSVMFVFRQLYPQTNGLLLGVMAFVVSYGLAWTIERWIERPAAKLRRKLSELETRKVVARL